MPKDTKSLGNNKAPAWESRGFVRKKEGVLFDTPSFFHIHSASVLSGEYQSTLKKVPAVVLWLYWSASLKVLEYFFKSRRKI